MTGQKRLGNVSFAVLGKPAIDAGCRNTSQTGDTRMKMTRHAKTVRLFLAVAMVLCAAGCADYSGPGGWMGDGDKAMERGDCGRALYEYTQAATRSIPQDFDPNRSENLSSLNEAVKKITGVESTCRVRDTFYINNIGSLVRELNDPATKGKYPEQAKAMSQAFLSLAELNADSAFDADYGVAAVIRQALATSDSSMLHRAAQVWLRQASWIPNSTAGTELVAAGAPADLQKEIKARIALVAKLTAQADAATRNRCRQANCKGGPDDGDPHYVAFERNRRDWHNAYAKLLAGKKFGGNMVALVQSLADKENRDLAQKLATYGDVAGNGSSPSGPSAASGRTSQTGSANLTGPAAGAGNIKYAGEFPAAPSITNDMCQPPGGAPSAGANRVTAWAQQLGRTATGVCNSAKAAYVLNARFAQIIRYCLARTSDSTRRQQGQQELASAQTTMRQAEETIKGSCQ
ncbi:MAG: hypothetical protein ACTHJ1_11450 [Bordetella sp.]